jgi:hypothetical protein
MRNYKIKKIRKNMFGGFGISDEQKELLKNNKYSNWNGMNLVFEKYVGDGIRIHIHEDRPFIMFQYIGEGCRPFTPAELSLKECNKETQANIKSEIKFLKEIKII